MAKETAGLDNDDRNKWYGTRHLFNHELTDAKNTHDHLAEGSKQMVSRKRKTSSEFPPAGIDIVEHELTVDMLQVSAKGKQEKLLESLAFKGRMSLQRRNPYRIARGKSGRDRCISACLELIQRCLAERKFLGALPLLSVSIHSARTS